MPPECCQVNSIILFRDLASQLPNKDWKSVKYTIYPDPFIEPVFFLSNNKCQLYGWNKVEQMLFKWTQIQYISCGVYSAIAKVSVVGSPSYWQKILFRRCNTNISPRERIFIYSWITLLITFQINFNSALFIYHLLQLRLSLGTSQKPRASLLNKQLWQEKTDSQLDKGREG